jgi:hypothetical protein
MKRCAWRGQISDGAKRAVRTVTLSATAVKSPRRWQDRSITINGYAFESCHGRALDLGSFSTRKLIPLFKQLVLDLARIPRRSP